MWGQVDAVEAARERGLINSLLEALKYQNPEAMNDEQFSALQDAACGALLNKLWHATPALRPSFADALPQLQSILETLPVQTADSALNRMPVDALDSLDALADMQIRPRTAGRR